MESLNKRMKSTHTEERLQLLEQTAPCKRNSEDQLDETDHFFMSMAKIVKKLSRYEQTKLRMDISTLVGNAELRQIEQPARASSSRSNRTSSN